MTEEGHPWVSLVVHKTRLQIAEDPSLDYEYLPLVGLKSFIQSSLELLFGKHSEAIAEKRVRPRERETGFRDLKAHKGPCRGLHLDRGNSWDSESP
jgi:aspartate/tyrosine/aromatic aminotransferase